MKVAELIEELKKMPQDYEAADGYGDTITVVGIWANKVELRTEALDEQECDEDIARAENEGFPSHPVVVGAEAVFTLDKE